MIVNIFYAPVPHRIPKGADDSLPPLRLEFDDGNYCDITPSRKLGATDKESRIFIEFAWSREPNDDQVSDVEAVMTEIGFGTPAWTNDTRSRAVSQAIGEAW